MIDLGSTSNEHSPETALNGIKDNPTVEILILEDDPDVGRLYQMKLAHPTRTIFVAPTMALAAEILDEHDIGLILLDLILPDADGRHFPSSGSGESAHIDRAHYRGIRPVWFSEPNRMF